MSSVVELARSILKSTKPRPPLCADCVKLAPNAIVYEKDDGLFETRNPRRTSTVGQSANAAQCDSVIDKRDSEFRLAQISGHVFTGSDLIQWMLRHLDLNHSLQEAQHLANLIASYGYLFPVDESQNSYHNYAHHHHHLHHNFQHHLHQLNYHLHNHGNTNHAHNQQQVQQILAFQVKNDNTMYCFQAPCLWPSNWDEPENLDYAIYLCKRTLMWTNSAVSQSQQPQNQPQSDIKKTSNLADYELETLGRLQRVYKAKWASISEEASRRLQLERASCDKLQLKVLAMQERAFWSHFKPFPGCVNGRELDMKKLCRISKINSRNCAKCKEVASSISEQLAEQRKMLAKSNTTCGDEPISIVVANLTAASAASFEQVSVKRMARSRAVEGNVEVDVDAIELRQLSIDETDKQQQSVLPSPSPSDTQINPIRGEPNLLSNAISGAGGVGVSTASNTLEVERVRSGGRDNKPEQTIRVHARSGNQNEFSNEDAPASPIWSGQSERDRRAPPSKCIELQGEPDGTPASPLRDAALIDDTPTTPNAITIQAEFAIVCARNQLQALDCRRDCIDKLIGHQGKTNAIATSDSIGKESGGEKIGRPMVCGVTLQPPEAPETAEAPTTMTTKRLQIQRQARTTTPADSSQQIGAGLRASTIDGGALNDRGDTKDAAGNSDEQGDDDCGEGDDRYDYASGMATTSNWRGHSMAAQHPMHGEAREGQEVDAGGGNQGCLRDRRIGLPKQRRQQGQADSERPATNSASLNPLASPIASQQHQLSVATSQQLSVSDSQLKCDFGPRLSSPRASNQRMLQATPGGSTKSCDVTSAPADQLNAGALQRPNSTNFLDYDRQRHQLAKQSSSTLYLRQKPDQTHPPATQTNSLSSPLMVRKSSFDLVFGRSNSQMQREQSSNVANSFNHAQKSLLTGHAPFAKPRLSISVASPAKESAGAAAANLVIQAPKNSHQGTRIKPTMMNQYSFFGSLISWRQKSEAKTTAAPSDRGQAPARRRSSFKAHLRVSDATESSSPAKPAGGAPGHAFPGDDDEGACASHADKIANSYVNFARQYAEYDPFLTQPNPSNPWQSDSSDFWELGKQTRDVDLRRVKRWGYSLRELLQDPAGRNQLMLFLEREFSIENLKFWESVQQLKRVKLAQVDKLAEAIWDEFLSPDATCPINIDSQSFVATKANIETCKSNRNMYDDAAAHVYLLMRNDSYPRFLRSDTYRQCLEDSEKRSSGSGSKSSCKTSNSTPLSSFADSGKHSDSLSSSSMQNNHSSLSSTSGSFSSLVNSLSSSSNQNHSQQNQNQNQNQSNQSQSQRRTRSQLQASFDVFKAQTLRQRFNSVAK